MRPSLDRLLLVISVIGVTAGLALRVVGAFYKPGIGHDEAISLLAAAGHQGAYAHILTDGIRPIGHWVAAGEWQQILEPSRFFAFRQINQDLAELDNHPPLYFWLLHIFTTVLGVHYWTGPLLNLLIDLVAVAVLVHFSRRHIGGWPQAWFIAAVWALSPTSLATSREVRHYALLALFTFALADRLWAGFYQPAKFTWAGWNLLAVSLIVAGGMLTHYLFPSIILVGGAILAARHLGRDIQRVAAFCLCAFIGCALVLLLDSYYLTPLLSKPTVGRYGTPGYAVPLRLWVDRVLSLVVPQAVLDTVSLRVLGVGLLVAAAGGTIYLWLARKVVFRHVLAGLAFSERRHRMVTGYLGEFTAGVAIAVLLVYQFTGATPITVRGYRYMSPVWMIIPPLVGAGLHVRLLARVRLQLAILLCLLMVASGVVAVLIETNVLHPNPVTDVQESDLVLIDNPSRGIVFPIVMRLEADQPVFVADQAYLLAHSQAWLHPVSQRGGVYYGSTYGRPEEGVQAIVEFVQRTNRVEPVGDPGRLVYRIFPVDQ